MRKIVQICKNSMETSQGYLTENITALCDDGTLWERSYCEGSGWGEWHRQADIPQPDPSADDTLAHLLAERKRLLSTVKGTAQTKTLDKNLKAIQALSGPLVAQLIELGCVQVRNGKPVPRAKARK